MRITPFLTLVMALAMCACGAPQGDAGRDKAQAPDDNRALLDAAQRPLEKARAVEDISAARKEGLDSAIEDASQ